MSITALPDIPSRSDPSTFSTKADAFLGALPTFVTEANALQTDVNAKQKAAAVSAAAALASEADAEAAAALAALTVAAAKWVPGTTYAIGNVVWSPSNYLSYRRKTNGAGTTDPSSDTTNWAALLPFSGNTKALAGTDTASAMTPADTAAAVAVVSNPKAMSQGVRTTYAASGSTGITVADNDNIDFGTGNFTLVWRGSLPDWTPTRGVVLLNKEKGANYYQLNMQPPGVSGKLQVAISGNIATSSIAPTLIDGTVHEIVAVITTGASSRTVDFYVDGYALGTQQTIADATTVTNTNPLYVSGYVSRQEVSTTHFAATYNRALTAAEVLDLYRNGVAPQHFDQTGVSPASQTPQTSGSLVVGKEYIIDTFVAGDNFTNVASIVSGTINTDGCIFVATGTTPTTWTNSSSLRRTGATLIISADNAQPAPGQILDSSGNKLHAMQPATGSSLTQPKNTFEFRWTNTWTASSAAQYIGGVNRAVLTAKHFIESIVSKTTVTTDVKNIEIGDGSDADRFVATVTPTAAPLVHTLANRVSDGTNLKLVVTPAAEATMTIEFIVRGFLLE